jgi:hypothetical protein
MGVVSVQSRKEAPDSGASLLQPTANPRYKAWIRTYRRHFRVLTNSYLDGPGTVLAGCGFALLDPYAVDSESDPQSFILALSCQRVDGDGLEWDLAVEYGPSEQPPEDPLDLPYEVSWSAAQYEEIVDRDTSNVAILNSAGDSFDPPIVRDQSRPVLLIVRNEATFSNATADLYRDKVNSDTFLGYAAGKVKVASITADRQYDQASDTFYWKVRYEFHIDRNGWQKKVHDAGFRARSGSTRTLIIIGGNPATSPVPLDGSGAALSATGTPVFLDFNVYETTAFSAFGF